MPVPDGEVPAVYGDGLLDGDEPTFEDFPATAPGDSEPVAAQRGGGIEPFDTAMVIAAGDANPAPDDSEPDPGPTPGPDADSGPVPGPRPASRSGRTRSSRRQPVPA